MFVDRGLTPVQVASTLMAWSIVGIGLQIPAGVLADRWSRRGVLCIAQWVRIIGFLIWIVWPNYWGYLAGMCLWGVKSALTNGTFEALLYDELAVLERQGDYARLVGRAQAVGYGAVLLASLSAGVSITFGYNAVIWASIAATLGATVAALALPRAPIRLTLSTPKIAQDLRAGLGFAARHPLIPWIIAMAAVSQAFGGGLEGFWPIYASGTGLALANVAYFSGAVGATQAIANVLAHRISSVSEALFYGVLIAAGVILAGAAGLFQPWTIGLILVVAGLFKVIDINFDARLQAQIPTESRATLSSVKSFAGQIVMTLMLAAFGPLASATSYRSAFLATGIAIAMIGISFLAARPFASRAARAIR